MDLTFPQDDAILYSILYTCMTLVFAMAVLSKFLTNEFRFGFRSVLSLLVLLVGEPLCHFLIKGTNGLLLFAFGCLFIYSVLPPGHLPADKKHVLITGCDSGFGYATAVKLDSIGLHVYACCLYPDGPGAADLKAQCSSRLKVLKLDVTNPCDIEEMKQLVHEDCEELGLWGLVNNAGVWYCAELEMTSDEVMRSVFDVNILGAVRVTRALLPLVRKSRGRIVNISSLVGRMSFEANGAYAMSKHAMSSFNDTLRLEMRKWGVHVSIVEPTGFKTGNLDEVMLGHRMERVWASLDGDTQTDYGRPYLEALYNQVFAISKKFPSDLTPVVRAIRSGLLSRRPQYRYPCGMGAGFMSFVYPLLPIWLADNLCYSVSMVPRLIRPSSLQS